jgi:hypothetical protein
MAWLYLGFSWLFPAIHALAAGRKTWPRGTADKFTSGPIPKFACARVTFRCELRNLRTTSNFLILVRF